MLFYAFVRAGYRRWSTYRTATFAAAFTNSVFGFLKCSVLLAALAGKPDLAGYTAAQLALFIWFGQGLIGVVHVFSWTEVADRIRSGDIVTDLIRPVHPVLAEYGTDLGRAAHGLQFRLVIPLLVGAVAFPLYVPGDPLTWPLTALSVLLATSVSFAARYLVNLLAFWWLDGRAANGFWILGTGALSGLMVPVTFLPQPLQAVAWCTPFPYVFQVPLDVVLERGGTGHQLTLVAGQCVAAAVLFAGCLAGQRVATRRLVVQGG